jgi:hypothetical protein
MTTECASKEPVRGVRRVPKLVSFLDFIIRGRQHVVPYIRCAGQQALELVYGLMTGP